MISGKNSSFLLILNWLHGLCRIDDVSMVIYRLWFTCLAIIISIEELKIISQFLRWVWNELMIFCVILSIIVLAEKESIKQWKKVTYIYAIIIQGIRKGITDRDMTQKMDKYEK